MARPAPLARRLFGAALLGCLLAGTALAQNPKRFFVGPSYTGGLAEYEKLFTAGSQWKWIQGQAQFFEFHVHTWMSPGWPGYLPNSVLRRAALLLDRTEMGVAVEAGGLRAFAGHSPATWSETGERRAQLELTAYRRWSSFGGSLDAIVLDSPFSKVLRDMGMPWDYAAHELADYLDIVKMEFPDVEVSLIEPVPHYRLGSYRTWGAIDFGDLGELLDTVLPILESRGHRIESFTADSPYTYNRQTPLGWEKLVAVQQLVRVKYGRRFGLFVNDSLGGNTSEELYLANSIKALEEFQLAGGDPDDFNLRGWYTYPKKFVPEDKAFTFMGIARTLMQHVYGNFAAPNPHSITVVFEDGTTGPLVANGGKVVVQDGGLEMTSPGELTIRGLRFEDPTVALVGDMAGLPPGSSVEIAMRPEGSSWWHRIALVAGGDTTSRVHLDAIDPSGGFTQTLATGPRLPVDPLASEFHLTLRRRGEALEVTLNGFEALAVPSPTTDPVALSIGATFAGPRLGRLRLDVVDIRDRGGSTSVDFDADDHVVFSLISDQLLTAFKYPLYLNTYEGLSLPYSEFEASIFPYMEVLTLERDHAVLRSTVKVPPSTLLGLVYDGDFEVLISD